MERFGKDNSLAAKTIKPMKVRKKRGRPKKSSTADTDETQKHTYTRKRKIEEMTSMAHPLNANHISMSKRSKLNTSEQVAASTAAPMLSVKRGPGRPKKVRICV